MELLIYLLIIGRVFLQRNALGWENYEDQTNADFKPEPRQSSEGTQLWNDVIQRYKNLGDANDIPNPIANEENTNFGELESEDDNDVPVTLEEGINVPESFESEANPGHFDGDNDVPDPFESEANPGHFDGNNDEIGNSPRVKNGRRRFRRRFRPIFGGSNMDRDDPKGVRSELLKYFYSQPKWGHIRNPKWRKLNQRRYPFRIGINVQEDKFRDSAVANSVSENQLYEQQNDPSGNEDTILKNEEKLEKRLDQHNIEDNRESGLNSNTVRHFPEKVSSSIEDHPSEFNEKNVESIRASELHTKSNNEFSKEVSSLIEDHPSNFLSNLVKNKETRQNTAVQEVGKMDKNVEISWPQKLIEYEPENSVNAPIYKAKGTNKNEPLNSRKSRNANEEFEVKITGNDDSASEERENVDNNLEKSKNISEWEKFLPRRDQFRVNWRRKPDKTSNQSTRRHFPIALHGWKIRSALLRKAQKALEDEEGFDNPSKKSTDGFAWREKPKEKILEIPLHKNKATKTKNNVNIVSSDYQPNEMENEDAKSNTDVNNFRKSFTNIDQHPKDTDKKENHYGQSSNKSPEIVDASEAELNRKLLSWRNDMLRPASNEQFKEQRKNEDREDSIDIDENKNDYVELGSQSLKQAKFFPEEKQVSTHKGISLKKGENVFDNTNNEETFHNHDQNWASNVNVPKSSGELGKAAIPSRTSENHPQKDTETDTTPSLIINEPEKKVDFNGGRENKTNSGIDWREQFMNQVKIGMEWAKESLRKDLKSRTSTQGTVDEGKIGDWIGQLQNQIFSRAGLSKQHLKDDIFKNLGNSWITTADRRRTVGELRDLWGRQITKAKDQKNKNSTNNMYNDADSKNLLSILEKDKDRKETESTGTSPEGKIENLFQKHVTLGGRRDAWEKEIIESDHFLNKKYKTAQRTTMGDLRAKWQKQIINNEDMNRTFPKYNKPHYDELIERAMKRLSSKSVPNDVEVVKNRPLSGDKYHHMQENKFNRENENRYKRGHVRAEGQPKQKRSLVFNTKDSELDQTKVKDLDHFYEIKNNISVTDKNNKITGANKTQKNENKNVVSELPADSTTTATILLDKLETLTTNTTTSINQSHKNQLQEKGKTQSEKTFNENLVNPSSNNFDTNSVEKGILLPNGYSKLESTVQQDKSSQSLETKDSKIRPTNFMDVLKDLGQPESIRKATTPIPKHREEPQKPLQNHAKMIAEPSDLTLLGRKPNDKTFPENKNTKVFTLASQLQEQPKSTYFPFENYPPIKPYFSDKSESPSKDKHVTEKNLFLTHQEDKKTNIFSDNKDINEETKFEETHPYTQLNNFPQLTKTLNEDKERNVNDKYFTELGTGFSRSMMNFPPSKAYSVKSEPIPLIEYSSEGLVKESENLSKKNNDFNSRSHIPYEINYNTETNNFQKPMFSNKPFSNTEQEEKKVTKLVQFQPLIQTTKKPTSEYYTNLEDTDESSKEKSALPQTGSHLQINPFLSEDHQVTLEEVTTRAPKHPRMSFNLFAQRADEFMGTKRPVNDRGIFTPNNDKKDEVGVTEFPLELDAFHQKVKSKRRNGDEVIRFLTKMLDEKPIVIPKKFGKTGKSYGSVFPPENEQKLHEIEEEKRKGSKLLAMSPKINVRKFYDTLASVLSADRNVWQRQFVENPFSDVVLEKFKEYLPIAFKQNTINTSYSIKYPKSQELDLTITNVIGVLPGRKEGLPTDEFTIIGAHYDSADNVENSEEFHNSASGITLLLEILRALATSEWQLENSIYFVAFDLGEVDRVGSSHFVKHYLVPKVIESGRGTLKGAYILNTLMAYNSTPESQRLPYELTEFAPRVAAAVSKEENKGDFYLVSARKNVDNELAEKLAFYWSLMPGPNFKLHVAEVNLTEVKRRKIHSIFNDGNHRSFWEFGEAQDHVLKAVHVGDTEYARASGECYDSDCQTFSTITPSSLLFVKKLGEALIATLLDFGGGILAEFRSPLRRRAILPAGSNRRIRRGRYALKPPYVLNGRFRRRRWST